VAAGSSLLLFGASRAPDFEQWLRQLLECPWTILSRKVSPREATKRQEARGVAGIPRQLAATIRVAFAERVEYVKEDAAKAVLAFRVGVASESLPSATSTAQGSGNTICTSRGLVPVGVMVVDLTFLHCGYCGAIITRSSSRNISFSSALPNLSEILVDSSDVLFRIPNSLICAAKKFGALCLSFEHR